MTDLMTVVGSWSGVISDVFADYPLEAAIFTVLSYPAFLHLQRAPIVRAKNQRATDIFLLLVAWLICVPILGAVLGVFYWLLDGVGNLIDLLAVVYERFLEQPIAVLVIASVALASFFVIGRVRPQSLSAPLRGLFVAGAFLLATLVLVPIVSSVLPAGDGPSSHTRTVSAPTP